MQYQPHPDTNNERAATGLRLVRIEGFSAPTTLQEDEQEAYLRRFSTIFIDESRCREGGLGQVLYGEDTWGRPLAVKTTNTETAQAATPAPSDDAPSSPTRDIATEAFRREYETLRTLSGGAWLPAPVWIGPPERQGRHHHGVGRGGNACHGNPPSLHRRLR